MNRHASGTYCAKTGTGGSNGSTMRMTPESAWYNIIELFNFI
jgi:catalase (peroxidase I)